MFLIIINLYIFIINYIYSIHYTLYLYKVYIDTKIYQCILECIVYTLKQYLWVDSLIPIKKTLKKQ
jgi:hypothetical protein